MFRNNINLDYNIYIIDYFIILKPLSALFVYLIWYIKLPIAFINIFFIFCSVFIILKSVIDKQKTCNKEYFLLFIIGLALFFNANTIYWISRYTADFFSIFLISLIIYFVNKKNKPLAKEVLDLPKLLNLGKRKTSNKIFIFIYTLLILVRIEWILLLPILNFNFRFYKLKKFLIIQFIFLLYPFFVGLYFHKLNSFLYDICIPLFLIFFSTLILQKIKKDISVKKLLIFFKIFSIFGIIIIFLSLTIYILSLLNLVNIPVLFRGLLLSYILMFCIYFLYYFLMLINFGEEVSNIDNLKTSNKEIIIIWALIFVVLNLIFWRMSRDSFRYYLMIIPILLVSIFINIHFLMQMPNMLSNRNIFNLKSFFKNEIYIKYKKMLLVFLFLVYSISTIIYCFILPFDILLTNYWFNRFKSNNLRTYLDNNSIVLSSTPLITKVLGYKTGNFCSFYPNYFKDKSNLIIIIDNKLNQDCLNIVLEWQEVIRIEKWNLIYVNSTNKLVELDKYKSKGQTSYFYKK